MNGEELREGVHEMACTFPGSVLTYPFGPHWEVYKVRGRIFALLTQVTGPQMVILKTDPPDGQALRLQYPFITPGYHMSKRHWNSVIPDPGLSPELVRELLTISYLLVVEGLPRARRPVDPAAYASAAGLAG